MVIPTSLKYRTTIGPPLRFAGVPILAMLCLETIGTHESVGYDKTKYGKFVQRRLWSAWSSLSEAIASLYVPTERKTKTSWLIHVFPFFGIVINLHCKNKCMLTPKGAATELPPLLVSTKTTLLLKLILNSSNCYWRSYQSNRIYMGGSRKLFQRESKFDYVFFLLMRRGSKYHY